MLGQATRLLGCIFRLGPLSRAQRSYGSLPWNAWWIGVGRRRLRTLTSWDHLLRPPLAPNRFEPFLRPCVKGVHSFGHGAELLDAPRALGVAGNSGISRQPPRHVRSLAKVVALHHQQHSHVWHRCRCRCSSSHRGSSGIHQSACGAGGRWLSADLPAVTAPPAPTNTSAAVMTYTLQVLRTKFSLQRGEAAAALAGSKLPKTLSEKFPEASGGLRLLCEVATDDELPG